MRRLSYERLVRVIEAGLLLGLSYLAVQLLPMRWWSSVLGNQNGSQAPALSEDQLLVARSVCSAISAVTKRSPLRLACLPQSMTRHLMLRRRGIESALYIGMRPRATGGVDTHAWTAVGSTVVPGEDVSSYSVVATFS
jgi:hypothetical protein